MGEPVEQSSAQPFRAKDLSPFLEGQVRGDHTKEGGPTGASMPATSYSEPAILTPRSFKFMWPPNTGSTASVGYLAALSGCS
jgi:hypothetical protein